MTTTTETAEKKPARKKPTTETVVDDVLAVSRGRQRFYLVGDTPLILNRMSQKAKRELLMPKGRKNAAERATSLKHNPVEEYRESAYRISDPSALTYLSILSTAFKRGLMTAALDLPGTKKAQIGRLTYVDGDYVGIFGVPKLFMSIVRSADMNKTPDVRTRAIIPQWACQLDVTYTKPLITDMAVSRLLMAAGLSVGVGDWRLEKGAGNFGLFRVVEPEDQEYLDIVKTGARAAQIEGMNVPECYDDETAELLAWYDEELASRRTKGLIAPAKPASEGIYA